MPDLEGLWMLCLVLYLRLRVGVGIAMTGWFQVFMLVQTHGLAQN